MASPRNSQGAFPRVDTEQTLSSPGNSKAAAASTAQNSTGPIDVPDALNKAYLFRFEPVVEALGSNIDKGLTDSQVRKRTEEYGPNQLEGGGDISIFSILLHQVANAMTLVSLDTWILPQYRWNQQLTPSQTPLLFPAGSHPCYGCITRNSIMD